jgi:hypothetical protein
MCEEGSAVISRTRHRLDVLLRQTSKLHDKEFEVLAEAWEPFPTPKS